MNKLLISFTFAGVFLLLAACGQKGPLFLPPPKPARPPQATQKHNNKSDQKKDDAAKQSESDEQTSGHTHL